MNYRGIEAVIFSALDHAPGAFDGKLSLLLGHLRAGRDVDGRWMLNWDDPHNLET